MTTYKLEKELPTDGEELPGVPDILRQHLLRKLRGPAVRVKVEAKNSAVSHVPLNSIRLAERGAANTNVDVDVVAELVAKIVHAYHVEHESDEGYLSLFRITCEMRSSENRKPMSERSFVLRYMPGREDEDSELMRENDVLSQALDSLRESRDSMAVQVADMHQVVLSFAQMMVEPIRASSEMSYHATQQWINGANMLVQGHQQLFNVEAVRTQEEAKTARINAVLAQFGGTIGNLTNGLVDFAFKKFNIGGGSKRSVPPQADPAARAEAQPSAATDASGSDGASAESTDAPAEPEVDPNRVLGNLIAAFSSTITPKQRRELNDKLTKKQLSALDNLFCAETNDEVADAWLAAFEALGIEKLMWMNGMLEVDQQNDFNAIRSYVTRYSQKREADKKK